MELKNREGANITGGENTFVRGSGAIALGGASKADGTGTVAIGQHADASSKINGFDSTNGYTYAPSISDNVAIGFRAESHADYTVALGAKAAANESGSNALGYNSQATGKSSLAIGYNTFANTKASATNNLESTIKGLTGSLSPESITQVNEYYAKLADFVDAQKNYNEAVAAKDAANIQKYSNLVRQYRNEVSAKKTALDKIPGVKDLISSTGVESNDTELKKALETVGGVSNLINKSLNEGRGTNLDDDPKKRSEKLNLGVHKDYIANPADPANDFREITAKDGDNAIAIGNYTSATGNASIAQGVGAYTKADASIAMGSLAYVAKEADQSIAVGTGAQSHAANSVVVGVRTSTYGAGDVAVGNRSTVLGDASVGIGFNATVLSSSGTAIGKTSRIGGDSTRSISIGEHANVGNNASNSIAIGFDTNVSDGSKNSIALGSQAKAQAENSMSFGYNATSGLAATNSITIGNEANNYASNALVLGTSAGVSTGSDGGISIGKSSHVTGVNTIALGTKATVTGTNSIVIGNNATGGTSAKGVDSAVVIGENAKASNSNSIVLGHNSTDKYEGSTPKLKPGVKPYDDLPPEEKYVYNADGSVVLEYKKDAMEVPSYLPRNSELGKTLAGLDKQGLGVVSVGGGEVEITNAEGNKVTVPTLRRITNVAPGALDTDVVTVAQLRAWRDTDPHFLSVNNIEKLNERSTAEVGLAADGDTIENRNSNYQNDQALALQSMALGKYAKVDNRALSAIAIGTGSGAYGQYSIGLGSTVYAGGQQSIAIGSVAKSRGQNSIAMGLNAEAVGKDAMSVGPLSNARQEGALALGANADARKMESIAFGRTAFANGTSGIAIGKAAKIGLAIDDKGKDITDGPWTGTRTVAIGESAEARRDQDIAIGYNSVTKGGDGVSIGSVAKTNGENSIAIGSNALVEVAENKRAGTNSIAMGRYAKALEKEVIAIGTEAKATADSGVAIGKSAQVSSFNSVALGREAKAQGGNSIAIGYQASTELDGSNNWQAVAIGQGAKAKHQNATALGGYAQAYGQHSTAVGVNATVQKSATGGAAFGKDAAVSAVNGLALGYSASAAVAGSVALGSESVAGAAAGTKGWDPAAGRVNNHTTAVSGAAASLSGLGSVSIGASGKERQITNLAAGSNDTDAVNVAQLKAVNLQIAGNTTAAAGADVRLHDQTLTVKGDDTYLTSKAAGNTITMDLKQPIKDKINSIFVTSFTGDQGSKVTPTATSNTVNVTGKKFTTGSEPNSIWADGGVRYETGNIGTFTTGNTVAIGMRPELKSKSFTAYKYDGNNQTTEAGPSISYNGINMNDKPITNLQAGVNAGDAVNKSQLDAITWNLGAKGTDGTINRVAPSTDTNKRIDLVGDGGISVTASGSTVTISGSKILDSMPVVYTDAAGNRVYKHTDGKYYTTENPPAGTKPVADVQARLVNTAPGAGKTATTDATVFNNVKSVIEKQGVTGNTAPTFTDRLSVAAANNPTAAVNVKDLNSTVADLKNKELHITPMEYTPKANGDVTLSYSDGNGSVVPNTTATIKGVAKNDLSNITDAGKKVITGLGTTVTAGKNITVTATTDNTTGQKSYAIAAADQVESVVKATAATDDENIAEVKPVTGAQDAANTKYGVGVSKKKVAEIAQGAVEVKPADGSDNVHVTPDTTTTPGKTVYKVSVDKTKLDTGVNTTVTGAGTATDPYKVNVQGDLNKITSITNEAGNGKVAFGANGVSTFSSGTAGDKTVTINGKEGKVVVGNGGTPVTIDGSTGHVTGLQNKEWTVGTTTPVSGRAATEDQLKHVSDAVADKADKTALWDLGVVATDGTSTKVTPQDVNNDNKRINLKGKGNVTVTADGNTITIEGENQNSIVVYTDAQGNRLYKRADGKFYKTKEPVAGERAVLANNVQSRLVNANGDSTTSPTVLNNVKSAIQTQGVGPDNLSPTFLERLEAAAKPTNNPNAAVNVSDLKSVVDAGMKYGANISEATGGANPVTNKLGSTVAIKGGATETDATNFDGTNVLTTVQQDEGNTTVNIKLKRDLGNIKSITNEAGNGKVAFGADGVTTFTSGAATGDKPVSIDGKLGKVVVGDGGKPVTIDGSTGHVTGLQNTTWDVTNPVYVSGRAATEDQLKTLTTELNKKSSTDYRLIANPEANSGGAYTVSNAGEIDLTVKDEITNATNTVKLKDIASKTALDALVGRSITLGGDNNSATDKQTLAKDVKFNITGDTNYITTTAKGSDVTLTFNDAGLAKKADEWKLAANGTVVDPDNKQVNLVNGDNIAITKAGNGSIKVSATGLAKEDLSNITNGGKKVITGLGPTINAGDGITVTAGTPDADTGKQSFTIAASKICY